MDKVSNHPQQSKRRQRNHYEPLAVLITILTLLVPTRLVAYPPDFMGVDDTYSAMEVHDASIHNDRFKIPQMIKALGEPHHHMYKRAILMALARWGAVEALPAIDAYAAQETHPDPGYFLQAARARLVAEHAATAIKDPGDAAYAKIMTFYKQLGGFTPRNLNQVVKQFEVESHGGDSGDPPMELYAMQQVADMVYHGPYKLYSQLPGVEDLQFSLDYASDLKWKLAPMNQDERLSWLVEELSHSPAIPKLPTEAQRFATYKLAFPEEQLAIDFGKPAGEAAAAKLKIMDAHRDQYTSGGYEALLEVLGRSGDKAQLPLAEHIRDDETAPPGGRYIASYMCTLLQSTHKAPEPLIYDY